MNQLIVDNSTGINFLYINEPCGLVRAKEPVTIGIPFARGTAFDEKHIFISDDKGSALDLQTKVLARWPDKSIKWLLCDFQVSVEAKANMTYGLSVDTHTLNNLSLRRSEATEAILKNLIASPSVRNDTDGTARNDTDGTVRNDTDGTVRNDTDGTVRNDTDGTVRNDSYYVCISKTIIGGLTLTDDKGRVFAPKINSSDVETEGALRTALKISGDFISQSNKFLAKFTARLSFYANKTFIKCEFTLHNPRKAGHKAGFWDLGAKGSIFFRDLSLRLGLNEDKGAYITEWRVESGKSCLKTNKPLRIYQDSSGGSNWMSANHINRFGKVMNSFCGYKVYENEKIIAEGKRAEPIVSIVSENKKISVALKDFWQNFPKSIEAQGKSIILGLFPKHYQDVFELQGGEQKTHTFYVDLENNNFNSSGLEWVNSPLQICLDPKLYSDSGVFGYLTLPQDDPNPKYKDLANCAIEGNETFFHKREVIDDYGWRNFGCLYADHEAVNCKPPHQLGVFQLDTANWCEGKEKEPLVSHYNNQYDCIQGLLLQFARTGDLRWFSLLEPLAYHTVDIDIYHTDKDKTAYNGGLFWHTEHYIDSRTSTHRTYSRNSIGNRIKKYCGGGPGNEHNYTTGLLNMYFLTGNIFFKEAVIGLANWVINMDDGSKTIFRFLDKGPTGLASQSASEDYHGPGRGSGNSLNALIDAHILTQDKKYILKAEELIQRCVHPQSDIKAQKLDEPEIRWFYLVFLQALGKYLDYKVELGEIDTSTTLSINPEQTPAFRPGCVERVDYMYHYARESLLHYARWMNDNEKLYKFLKDKLLIWTETWPAQDIRKSVVFDYAAKYSIGAERNKFLEKSEYFYNGSIEDLSGFRTKTLLRPVVLMMHFGLMHGYFLKYINDFQPITEHSYDFGKPQAFVHQKARIKNILLSLMSKLRYRYRRINVSEIPTGVIARSEATKQSLRR